MKQIIITLIDEWDLPMLFRLALRCEARFRNSRRVFSPLGFLSLSFRTLILQIKKIVIVLFVRLVTFTILFLKLMLSSGA